MKSTFDHISEKWELLKRRVSQHNAHGLTDLAQHCEDIVGQIFHILYDLSLQNLNRQTPHFPSVDLPDSARGIYLQVTTQQSHLPEKIRRTADSFFNGHPQDTLLIFLLFRKPSHPVPLPPGMQIFVLDSADLLNEIRTADDQKQRAVLDLLRQVEDTVLHDAKADFLQGNRELLVAPHCAACPGQPAYFVCGLGRVRVDAYLPISYRDTFSCIFTFARSDLAAANPSLSGSEAARRLFTGRELGLSSKRPLIGFISPREDLVRVHLGSAVIHVDLNTAEQICTLTKMLGDAYEDHLAKIRSTLGCGGFTCEDLHRVPILHLARELWEDMFFFANRHDALQASGPWDRFLPYHDPVHQKRIQISSTGRSLLCSLSKEGRSAREVCVFWEPGYDGRLADMDGFDNQSKWRADHTLEWITQQWLPLLANIRYHRLLKARRLSQRLFAKPISFDEFSRRYMSGVTSLSERDR